MPRSAPERLMHRRRCCMLPANDLVGNSKTRTAQRDYAIGIGFIIIVTLLWTLSNFVTQVGILILVLLGSTYSVI